MESGTCESHGYFSLTYDECKAFHQTDASVIEGLTGTAINRWGISTYDGQGPKCLIRSNLEMYYNSIGDNECGSDYKCVCRINGCAENEHVSNGACTACPTGTFRDAGDDPFAGDTECAYPEKYKVVVTTSSYCTNLEYPQDTGSRSRLIATNTDTVTGESLASLMDPNIPSNLASCTGTCFEQECFNRCTRLNELGRAGTGFTIPVKGGGSYPGSKAHCRCAPVNDALFITDR